MRGLVGTAGAMATAAMCRLIWLCFVCMCELDVFSVHEAQSRFPFWISKLLPVICFFRIAEKNCIVTTAEEISVLS